MIRWLANVCLRSWKRRRLLTLVLDDGRSVGESKAILWYLGQGTPYVLEDHFEAAKMVQWMFFEQYSHEQRFLRQRGPEG